ncbi:YitT family protein [Romboutsia sp.]|uniref:YitT family protein n=1 Tax=Romboutsia sp. TaxID=1965302 RepID=UPI003F41ADC5
MINKKLLVVEEFLFMAVGCFLLALSLNLFFRPHAIAPGGISGLSIIINSITGVPLFMINLCFNIPLFLVAYKILNKKDVLKTLVGITLVTISLKITGNLGYIDVTNDPLLASIIGSSISGIGLGLIFRINGTTGGTDLIGLLANKFFPFISVTVLMGIADVIVVTLSGIVSKEIEIALYSGLSLVIIVKVADLVIDGFNYSKSFTIISDYSKEISDAIIVELGRGATLLKAMGAYSKVEKDVILVVVSKRQVVSLKRLIKSIDPHAFIIVSDIQEALGEGFSTIEV